MLIGLTDEQRQLRGAVRAQLARIGREEDVRRAMAKPDGMDAEAWGALGTQGWLGIAVGAEFGGGGGSLVDQGVVLEELGRCLAGGPYFSSAVLAARALVGVQGDGGGEVGDLLEAVASGAILTLALVERSQDWSVAGATTFAERAGSEWRLTGGKQFVPDGGLASTLLVVARTERGISLFAVEPGSAGVEVIPCTTLDQTRPQAQLRLDAARARLLGAEGAALPGLERALLEASACLAVEQVGGMQQVLDLVVAYVSARRQFGRPVGSFQAVQHACATMLVDIEAARSAAYCAVRAAAEGSAELPEVAHLAKSWCSQTYRRVTDRAIQLFGGIGITWDHPIHLYFKRARSSELLLGSPAYHRAQLAKLIDL